MRAKLRDLCGLLLHEIEQHWREFIIANALNPTVPIMNYEIRIHLCYVFRYEPVLQGAIALRLETERHRMQLFELLGARSHGCDRRLVAFRGRCDTQLSIGRNDDDTATFDGTANNTREENLTLARSYTDGIVVTAFALNTDVNIGTASRDVESGLVSDSYIARASGIVVKRVPTHCSATAGLEPAIGIYPGGRVPHR